VDALDDTTLQIELQEPAADFLMVLAGYRLASLVASPTAVQRWGKDYKFHPVGAGPFKFVAWTPRQQVVLEKNEHYFKPGLPYLDHIGLPILRLPSRPRDTRAKWGEEGTSFAPGYHRCLWIIDR